MKSEIRVDCLSPAGNEETVNPAAGFSLTEITQMFSQEGQPELDREMLNQKAEQLEQMTRRLHFISEGLRHAAVCPAENHMQCPTFQKFLKAAIEGEYQPTKLE